MLLEIPHAGLSADEWPFQKCLNLQAAVYWDWRIMMKYSKVPQQKSRPALIDNDNCEVKLVAECVGLSPAIFLNFDDLNFLCH